MIKQKEFTNTKTIKYYYLCLEVNKKTIEISLSYDVDESIYLENWDFLQDYNLTKEEINEIEDYLYDKLDLSKAGELI